MFGLRVKLHFHNFFKVVYYFYLCVCVGVCGRIRIQRVRFPGDNKEGTVYPDSLAADAVNCPAWVLRIEHGCFVRAGHTIAAELVFQPPSFNVLLCHNIMHYYKAFVMLSITELSF